MASLLPRDAKGKELAAESSTHVSLARDAQGYVKGPSCHK